MSLFLIIVAAGAVAILLMGGVLWATARSGGGIGNGNVRNWAESGHGNPDGYGGSVYDCGGDAGCGGGE
ncbi:hypothetical protein [Aurantiacibacter sp. MUD61]|uniref:hypothetical protein n=1 Tax=Aurantiacibacter sp. MUD61 TaxID=3009083 RepID=UPI0022F129C1|nr:hypothetical protein [Aurantiacibacter sp. MUD61]